MVARNSLRHPAGTVVVLILHNRTRVLWVALALGGVSFDLGAALFLSALLLDS